MNSITQRDISLTCLTYLSFKAFERRAILKGHEPEEDEAEQQLAEKEVEEDKTDEQAEEEDTNKNDFDNIEARIQQYPFLLYTAVT